MAYQALGAHDMALVHYRAHLNISRELKDTAGEACALLNLANCLSSRQEFGQAVPFYENYLMLSQVIYSQNKKEEVCQVACNWIYYFRNSTTSKARRKLAIFLATPITAWEILEKLCDITIKTWHLPKTSRTR